jgi:radical SAM family uncharacterized protein/radical SAM-linked protein
VSVKDSLWKKIEWDLLPFVSKPARYAGYELNAVHKSRPGELLKIALCFPEMYEIGMPYLGMRILYNLINKREDCAAERVFMVWPDMEKRMRDLGIPLFSLESARPLREFDILGFHLTYEMNYPAVIAMLELAGIAPHARDRSETDPLVIAGGPSAINPEPVADFFDAIFIGDAEEAIFEIIDSVKKSRESGLKKIEFLEKLAEIPGLYIPSFYNPEYSTDGVFLSLRRINDKGPEKIKIRSVPELRQEFYPRRQVVPYIETSQDHLSVEIMRGCVRGCRFCQAGYQYRPRRQRAVGEVKNEIFENLHHTGYDDVTLLSLSSTDYDGLGELLESICPALSEMNAGLGLPSLRPETITPELLNWISTTRKSGLTIAPEAGSERLRKSLGKDIADEEIYSAVENAVRAGWQSIKFYFMIGLPNETAEDIEAIAAILRKVSYMARQGAGRVNINVSISPFCPKILTPWQWEKLATRDELEKKREKISRRVKSSNIKISFRDFDLTLVEAAISRGDRRLGQVIYSAYREGARLDGWSEHFDVRRWTRAFDSAGLDISQFTGFINEDSPLPWDHIDKGISKDFLKKENRDSKDSIPPKTAFSRLPEIQRSGGGDTGYGRRAKRVAKQAAGPKGTYRLRIHYTIGPELRWMSHLDNIRTIFRAIRRGGIPVAFSEGFNPHQKVSFGPPLPVGYTSEAEYFDVILTEPFKEEYINNLNTALPGYIRIVRHKYFFAKPGSLVKQLNLARYEIPLPENVDIARAKIDDLLTNKKLTVTRYREKDVKVAEVGEFIDNITLEDNMLLSDVLQTPDGHIKPDEILIYGLGLIEDTVRRLPVHRKSQFSKFGGRLIDPLDLV